MKYILLILAFLPILSFAQDRSLRTDSTYVREEVIDGKKFYRIVSLQESEPIDSSNYITNRFNVFINSWNEEKADARRAFARLQNTMFFRGVTDELEALTSKDQYDLAYERYSQSLTNSLWIIRDRIADTTFTAILAVHPNPNVQNRLMFIEGTYENAGNGQFTFTSTPRGIRTTVVVRTDEAFELLTGDFRIPVFKMDDLEPTPNGISRVRYADAGANVVAIRLGLTLKEE